MDDPVVLLLLRAVHIVVGAFWMGSVLLVTFYLLPATRATGVASEQMLQELVVKRKLPAHLIWAGWVTVLAGVGLYMRNMSLSHGAWARTPMGIGISIGSVAAVAGLMIWMTVYSPTARRIALAGQSGAPPLGDADYASLARRLRFAAVTTTLLLVIAVIAMATARYY
jgi:uncharacterized membrane protein